MTSYRDESVRPGTRYVYVGGRGRSRRAAERQSAIKPRRRNGATVVRDQGSGIREQMDRIYQNQAGHGRTIRDRARRPVVLAQGRHVSATTNWASRCRRRAASVSRAGDAVDRRLHRPELQGSRRRDEQEAAGRAAGVPQAAERGDRPGRRDPAAVVGRPHRARSRDGGGDRQARLERQGRRRDGLRARHHLPQRRHRARAAGQGRAVFARQGLRHVLRRSARASRSASIRRSSTSRAGSTASGATTPTPAS